MGGYTNETSFDRILNSSCVDLPQLRNLSWHGIPVSFLKIKHFVQVIYIYFNRMLCFVCSR